MNQVYSVGVNYLLKSFKVLLGAVQCANTNPDKPNIVFILTDDQGFSDVSWRNRQVRTPNLDVLRRDGLTIEGAYSQSRCTPTRMSLMTGKYTFNIGFTGDFGMSLIIFKVYFTLSMSHSLPNSKSYWNYKWCRFTVRREDSTRIPQG